MKSELEELFAFHCKALKLPPFERQFRFSPDRKWTSDFAWPNSKLLVEIEGGVWMQGRHQRAMGFQKDLEKYNAATMLGYSILRFSPKMVESAEAVDMVLKFILSIAT